MEYSSNAQRNQTVSEGELSILVGEYCYSVCVSATSRLALICFIHLSYWRIFAASPQLIHLYRGTPARFETTSDDLISVPNYMTTHRAAGWMRQIDMRSRERNSSRDSYLDVRRRAHRLSMHNVDAHKRHLAPTTS